MAKKYKKIGIVRDNNLSDLSNTTASLNNLLTKLSGGVADSFVTEDLDAIRGISSLGITNTEYRKLIGSSVQVTNKNGTITAFSPKITYQNKIDKLKTVSGEPRIYGGNGLTAKYYSSSNINENNVNIFTGTPFTIDNFWEGGEFIYSGKITSSAINVNGGVEWEGYFIPVSTGRHTFSIDSSACFTFEFQTQGYTSGIGTYTELSRIGITTTLSGSGIINTNTITLSSSTNTNYVAIGQSVSASGIVNGTTVSSFNRSNGVITLTPPQGTQYSVSSSFTGNITFSKDIGQSTSISYTTYSLEAQKRYRIRFRYFIPQAIDASNRQRYIIFSINRPSNIFSISNYTEGLRYNNLYSLNYDFSENVKGSFNFFSDNSINSGGGTVGSSIDVNGYVKVTTPKKINISYQPKTSVSDVVKSSVTCSTTSGSNILDLSDTTNIEVGNYVFGNGIPDGTRVEFVSINDFIILSQNATLTSISTYTFIEHRGFVKRVTGSASSGTITLTSGNTTLLSKDMIVIGTGLQSYTKISTISTSTSLTISPSQSASSTILYFYQSKGLINNGLSSYCGNQITRCLITSTLIPIGSTVIPLDSFPNDIISGIIGWNVQGLQFSPGTNVISSSISPPTITINSPTIKNLIVGSNFTITEPNSGNKQLCCPPTDISDPFNQNLNGLETVADAPNLRINSGNIIFSSLTANITSLNITTANVTETSKSRISIQTPTGIYRILCA